MRFVRYCLIRFNKTLNYLQNYETISLEPGIDVIKTMFNNVLRFSKKSEILKQNFKSPRTKNLGFTYYNILAF